MRRVERWVIQASFVSAGESKSRLRRFGPWGVLLAGLLFLSGPVRADDDPSQASSDPHVTARTGTVGRQDFNMDVRSGWDLKVPKQVTLGPDGQQIIVTSMRLQPPPNWSFNVIPNFVSPAMGSINTDPQSEGWPIFPPWWFVDVQWGLYGITQVGVLKDTANEVQAFCILPAEPTNAANFPLEMEGNLQPPSGSGGPGEPVKFRWMAKTAKICIDLDVDSDNNNGLESLDQSPEEDQIENTTGDPAKPGKLLGVNDGDDNADGVPNYAEFVPVDPPQKHFVKAILKAKEINLDNAKLKLEYPSAENENTVDSPATTQPTSQPAKPRIRLWTKQSSESRNPASINLSGNQSGDFVPPGTFSNNAVKKLFGTSDTATLYVEGLTCSGNVADARLLATLYPDGNTDAGARKMEDAVRLTAVMVKFVKMWETKNKTNQILNTAKKDDPAQGPEMPDADECIYGTPRNFLYVTSDTDSDRYKITVDADIKPTALKEWFVCVAFRPDGSKVSDSDHHFLSTGNTTAIMDIPAYSLGNSYEVGEDMEIKIGYDNNHNALFDTGEIAFPVYALKDKNGLPLPPKIRGFNQSSVASAKQYIKDGVEGSLYAWLAYIRCPEAQTLVRIFYDNDVQNISPLYFPTTIYASVTIKALSSPNTPNDYCEWLTHNAGASFFDTTGIANISYYSWGDQTYISQLLVNNIPFSELPSNQDILNKLNTEAPQTIEDMLLNAPLGSEVVLPNDPNGYDLKEDVLANLGTAGEKHWSPTWVPKQTVEAGSPSYIGIPDPAGAAFARLRITNGRYWFVLRKGLFDFNTVFVSLRIEGVAEDLYDFNQASGGLAAPAAVLQLSYGNGNYAGRNNGVIYRSQYKFKKEYFIRSYLR